MTCLGYVAGVALTLTVFSFDMTIHAVEQLNDYHPWQTMLTCNDVLNPISPCGVISSRRCGTFPQCGTITFLVFPVRNKGFVER